MMMIMITCQGPTSVDAHGSTRCADGNDVSRLGGRVHLRVRVSLWLVACVVVLVLVVVIVAVMILLPTGRWMSGVNISVYLPSAPHGPRGHHCDANHFLVRLLLHCLAVRDGKSTLHTCQHKHSKLY